MTFLHPDILVTIQLTFLQVYFCSKKKYSRSHASMHGKISEKSGATTNKKVFDYNSIYSDIKAK